MAKIASKAHQSQGMLLFQLNRSQHFAIGTLKVREIIPFRGTTKLPYSHEHVIGCMNIRNITVPVIDMAAAIGMRPVPKETYGDQYLIVTDCLRTVVAFMVRSIDKIIECDWQSIESPPENLTKNAFITGVTRYEDKLVQLLDVELLLSKIYPQSANAKMRILTDVEREKLKAHNILLVDDSSLARRQLTDALDSINIPYHICNNGLEALSYMRQVAREGQAIDMLVSDIEMPGLDGYELVFEVQNDPALTNSYRILHTSLSSEISVERAHQVGAHQALEKFNATELIEAMLLGAKTLTESAMNS